MPTHYRVLEDLTDAQQMARDNPTTFEVPSARDLARLKKGDAVKICRNDERFWAHIIRIDGDTVYATVGSRLVMPKNADLPLHTRVSFEKRHIYQTM